MPAHYTIGGCQVQFPHQAYGVQLSFMSKVIAALEGGHNALLEAPTGGCRRLGRWVGSRRAHVQRMDGAAACPAASMLPGRSWHKGTACSPTSLQAPARRCP